MRLTEHDIPSEGRLLKHIPKINVVLYIVFLMHAFIFLIDLLMQ